MTKETKEIDKEAVKRIQRKACEENGGSTPKGSHASRAQRAYDRRKNR